MRTFLLLIIMVSAGLITVSAPAKSKSEGVSNCLSQAEAREAYPDKYLRYRAVSGARCWYAPGHRPIAKKQMPVRVAAVPPIAAQPESGIESGLNDDLTYVKDALCGGPCPRFGGARKVVTISVAPLGSRLNPSSE
jgi:hypothetical protein